MAKKNGNGNGQGGEQFNLFPFNPAIKNLGVVDIKLKSGVVEATIVGATEANDLSMLTPARWAEGHIEAAVRILGGDWSQLYDLLGEKHAEFWVEQRARQADERIGYARISSTPEQAAAEMAGGAERQSVEGVHGALAALGLQVSAETVAGWTESEIAEVRTWLEVARAVRESSQEFRAPMPACLADHVEWLDGVQPARDAGEIGEAAAIEAAAARERVGDALALAGVLATPELIATWTDEQVGQAEQWAANAIAQEGDHAEKAMLLPEFLMGLPSPQEAAGDAKQGEAVAEGGIAITGATAAQNASEPQQDGAAAEQPDLASVNMTIPTATVRKGGKRGNGAATGV
jgi:hypothetical protein